MNTIDEIMRKVNRLCGEWQQMGEMSALDRSPARAGARADALEGELRSMVENALAPTPDPRVGPLAEALERINTLAFSAYDLDVKTQGDDLRGIINQIGRWAEAALAAKGEVAADEPWTKSEERMPDHNEEVRVRRVCGTREWLWYADVVDELPTWCENERNGGGVTFHSIGGTEWRPVREG